MVKKFRDEPSQRLTPLQNAYKRKARLERVSALAVRILFGSSIIARPPCHKTKRHEWHNRTEEVKRRAKGRQSPERQDYENRY